MLLPNDIHPERTVYYNGAYVLEALNEMSSASVLGLYERVRLKQMMTLPMFILCLDWLYLLQLIALDEGGKVTRCT